jgi:transcription-repair coupling factor (superfamily II helicase)
MELIDRFGIPPQAVKQLFSVHQVRLKRNNLDYKSRCEYKRWVYRVFS